MIEAVYVGSDCSEIGDREFDAIGQRATFSEQGFIDAVLGGAAFIDAADFSRLGFTLEELAEYGPLGTRVDPTSGFMEKLTLAQQIYRETADRFCNGAAFDEVAACSR